MSVPCYFLAPCDYSRPPAGRQPGQHGFRLETLCVATAHSLGFQRPVGRSHVQHYSD